MDVRILSLIAFLGTCYFVNGASRHVVCNRTFRKVGCISASASVMSTQLVNDRDPSSSNYQGHMINWKEYPSSLHSLVCRCAEKARKLGYKNIGIRYFGECYGTKEVISIIDIAMKSSRDCIGPSFSQCVHSDSNECSGRVESEYVYML